MPRFVFFKASNFFRSIKVIIDQSQGQISRSKVKNKSWSNVKGQGHVFSVIAAILMLNNTLSIATFHLSH